MPTIGDVYYELLKTCKDDGVLSSDIRECIAKNEGLIDQIDVILNKDKEMKNYSLFMEQYKRLKNNEPVEYILNESSFLHRKLYIDNRVLIPRGETAELIAKITERIPDSYDPRNYLMCADIGTGSGAIALTLDKYFPNWIVLASDISEDALEVAKKNFNKYGCNIETHIGDALTPYIENDIKLDVIVSNPPYITRSEYVQDSVRGFEPDSALWFDEENNVYKSILRDAHLVLRDYLFMAFEISPELVDYLKELMKKYLTNYKFEFEKDLNGDIRFLFVELEGGNNGN